MNLTEMPSRIASLPRDERGYPVPWFVHWENGIPLFPIMVAEKWMQAVKEKRCWVCGDPMGVWKAFVTGPMCGISRTSGEPPSHLDCALFSVMNCPFLVNPKMKRIQNETTAKAEAIGGVMIKRNPGVSLIWITKTLSIFRDPERKPLIRMGDPVEIQVWARGRRATMEELTESIESGVPALEAMAPNEDDRRELGQAKADFFKVLAATVQFARKSGPQVEA